MAVVTAVTTESGKPPVFGKAMTRCVESGRVMASYELRFVPLGGGGEQVFRTAAELVRVRGEWRIARPIGEVSMPEWKPIPRTVDI